MQEYSELDFKKPIQSNDYKICSDFVVGSISNIIQNSIDTHQNKIIINTNLKLGLPMENINKVAGPFVEAWAVETFTEVVNNDKNQIFLDKC